MKASVLMVVCAISPLIVSVVRTSSPTIREIADRREMDSNKLSFNGLQRKRARSRYKELMTELSNIDKGLRSNENSAVSKKAANEETPEFIIGKIKELRGGKVALEAEKEKFLMELKLPSRRQRSQEGPAMAKQKGGPELGKFLS